MDFWDLPGLSWIKRRRLLNQYRAELLRHKLDLLRLNRPRALSEDVLTGSTTGSGMLVDNDSGPLFDPQAYMTADAVDEGTYREMQRRFALIYRTHPLAHGWLETLVDFIVGDEFQLKSVDHDPRTQEWFDRHWENMAGPWASRKWPGPMFARDLVRRTLVYGEDFQREYVNPIDGSLCYRPMHPVFVYNPGAVYVGQMPEWTPNYIASFGIQTDPEDILRVLAYYYDPYRNGRMRCVTGYGTYPWPYLVRDRSAPPPPVIHTKIGDVDMKRGESVLLCIIEYLIELEKILKALRKQQQIRAEIAYWDEPIEGMTPEQLQALIDANTINDGGVNDGRTYAHQSGTSGVLNNLKRVYATPNLQAEDGDWAVRRVLQCIAVGLQEAYYLVSADSKGETMAAIRETSFPQVRSHKAKQRFFGITAFEDIAERIVKSGIAHGSLSPMSYRNVTRWTGGNGSGVNILKSQERCERATKFVGLYPEIQVRDMKAETDALAGQLGMKLISKRSAQIRLGLNSDEENAQIELERIEDPESNEELEELLAAMRGGGNGDSNNNGGRGGNGRSDSKAVYRRQGTKS